MSRDDRHGTADNYWSFIGDMWRSLGAVVADNAHVVIRIGPLAKAPLTDIPLVHQISEFSWADEAGS